MAEVVNNLKDDPVSCPCGCELVGYQRVRAWSSDGLRHVKKCVCRRCTGGKQRGKATKRESRIAKDTGGVREPLSGGLSGVDGRAGLWVWEETAQESIVRGFRRWWTSKGVTSKVARMFGRPGGEARAFILSWDGRPQVVISTYADWVGQVRGEVDAEAEGRSA